MFLQEVRHAQRRTLQRPTLLSRAGASDVKDSPPKLTLSVDIGWFTAKKNSSRSSGGMIRVLAVRDAGFKKCCMHSGGFDGSRRNYFFPRVKRGCRPLKRTLIWVLYHPALTRWPINCRAFGAVPPPKLSAAQWHGSKTNAEAPLMMAGLSIRSRIFTFPIPCRCI